MSEPVNLNKARKARGKAEAKAQAAANRVKFGRGKAEKVIGRLDAAREARRLDGAKLSNPTPSVASHGIHTSPEGVMLDPSPLAGEGGGEADG